MAETLSDEALILRVKDWQTADKYVIAFTRNQGKQRFIAYGARYPKNVNGRLLQPFACLEISLLKGQRLDKLQSCSLVKLPQAMDMTQMAYAAVAAELTALFTEDGQPQEELYVLLEQTLKLLRERNPRIVVLAFALKLLTLTGIWPSVEECVACGGRIEAEAEVWFSLEQGGLISGACHQGATGSGLDGSSGAGKVSNPANSLPCGPLTRELWRNLLFLDMDNPARFTVKGVALMELERILYSYIRYQTDKELNSLQFLRELGL